MRARRATSCVAGAKNRTSPAESTRIFLGLVLATASTYKNSRALKDARSTANDTGRGGRDKSKNNYKFKGDGNCARLKAARQIQRRLQIQ
jgi:hypothetical protein